MAYKQTFHFFRLFAGKQKIRKPRLWRFLFLLMLSLFCGYLSFGDYGFLQMAKLLRRRAQYTAQLQRLQSERDSLQREIYLLQNDSAAIERIAREKYGMSKPNEKVFIFTSEEQK